MSKKEDNDLEVEGRIHDGYDLAVEVTGGRMLLLRDFDDLAAVSARWLEALKASLRGEPALVFFSGARTIDSFDVLKAKALDGDEQALELLLAGTREGSMVVNKIDGKGCVGAPHIVAIRYAGSLVSYPQDSAVAAVKASADAQRAAAEDMVEEAQEAAEAAAEAAAAQAPEGQPTQPQSIDEAMKLIS